jgi:Na+/H+-dicarboxylate symporter
MSFGNLRVALEVTLYTMGLAEVILVLVYKLFTHMQYIKLLRRFSEFLTFAFPSSCAGSVAYGGWSMLEL